MSVFAKREYPVAEYAAHRIPAPPSLLCTVLNYHRGPRELCADFGTGHGIIARALADFCPRVIAIDPSEGMLREAQANTDPGKTSCISYHQSSAEDVPFIQSGTVDLVLAVQAAHWFDPSRAWKELQRIVRPQGTVAFWNWGRYFLIGRENADRALRQCSEGSDHLGPYWPQPGIAVWDGRMRAVECTDGSKWEDITRLEYEPCLDLPKAGTGDGVQLSARLKLGELESLLRTWSSVHEWRAAHPGVRSRAEGGDGDVIDALMEEMIQVEPDWRDYASQNDWRDVAVEIEVRSILLLARRRG